MRALILFSFLCLNAWAKVAWVNPENINDPRFDPKTGYAKASLKTDTSLEFRNFRVPTPRASFVDRKGVVLARDEAFLRAAIWLEGGNVEKVKKRFFEDLEILGKLINRKVVAGEIPLKLFEERRGTPIVFNQKLNPEEIEAIRSAKLPRIRVIETTQRKYPKGELMAHALGWSTSEAFLSDTYLFHPIKGRSGIESLLDKEASGKMGTIEVMRDSSDFELKMIFETQGIPAEPIELGLDYKLQAAVLEVVKNDLKEGVVLVADARSGEIPVMLSLPSFDPTLFVPFVKENVQIKYLRDDKEPLANRIYRNYRGTNWESLREHLKKKHHEDFEYFVSEASADYAKIMGRGSFVPSDLNVTPLFLLTLLQRLTLSPALSLQKKNALSNTVEDLHVWNYPDFTSPALRIGSFSDGTDMISQFKKAQLYLGGTQDLNYNILIISEDKNSSEERLLSLKQSIKEVLK